MANDEQSETEQTGAAPESEGQRDDAPGAQAPADGDGGGESVAE